MSSTVHDFQLSRNAAEHYESSFVPRLFAPWAGRLVEAAGVSPGHRVLDVACGTGAVARAAADRLGARGSVTGVDLNPGMLAVARRLRPDLEWREADAAALPFPDGGFDRVLCQAALMFFPAPEAALREMARVTAPGGRIGLQVWASLDAQPAYRPFVAVVRRHAGEEADALMAAYWSMGERDHLARLLESAGLRVEGAETLAENTRFASVEEMVATEVEGTPLAGRLGAEVRRRLVEDAAAALAPFLTAAGLDVPLVGHIVVARGA